MPFKFEMSDVSDSLQKLYTYVAEIADEAGWKNEPLISDTPVGTSGRFFHPAATPKEVKANSEPYSNIVICLPKPYVPQFSFEFIYTGKKALVRFEDMLKTWNKKISDEFFTMATTLDGFTFKLQIQTTFKKISSAKYEDVFVVPSTSLTFDDVVENLNNVRENCSSTEMAEAAAEEGKVIKKREPRVVLCRDFIMDDLTSENSAFDHAIKVLHDFMLTETKIVSEKDIEKLKRGRSKIEGKNKFKTILSNRADREFYCRLTKAELERLPEKIGVTIWDKESFEEKKYIRGALKLVREI
jgi:hypothetical protein